MENISQIKKICSLYDIRPLRRKGQNFLINERIINNITEASELSKNETILEIGPGLGNLTEELAKRVKKVLAVEIDKKLVGILREKFKNQKNIEIILGDILKIGNWPVARGLGPVGKLKIKGSYKVVANLPYNITGAVLRKFLSEKPKPNLMVLMIQKEVAERILAKNKKESMLSLMVKFYGQPEIIRFVSKNNFWPRPKVDSALLKISRINTNLPRINTNLFFKFLRVGFVSPRKQLVNNLAKIIKKEELKKKLEEIDLNPKTRAEDLTPENWLDIYRYLHAN